MKSSPKYKLSFLTLLRILIAPTLTFLIIVVVFWVFALPDMKNNLIGAKKTLIKQQVNTAWHYMQHQHQLYTKGKITLQKAQNNAKNAINALRYGHDNKEYFWIIDKKPVMITHPYIPELNNKNVSDFEDPTGKKLFSVMVEKCKKQNSGYVSYQWQWKDFPGVIVPKISYVKNFEPWGWIIGTGIYINDVQHRIDQITQNAKIIFAIAAGIILSLTLLIGYQSIKKEQQQKAYQQTIHHEKENLKVIFQSIGDAIIVSDTAGKLSRMNKVAEELTGYNWQEATQQPIEQIFKITNSKTGKTVPNPIDIVLEKGKTIGLANHTTLTSKGGQKYQIADSGSPVKDEDEKIIGAVLVFRDVSEEYLMKEKLKTSEERFKLAIEGSRDGLWDWDLTTNNAYHSTQFARMLGYETYEMPNTNRAWEDLLHPDDKAAARQKVEDYLNQKINYYESTFRMQTKSGQYKWITARGKCLFNEKGVPVRFVGFNTDVTAHKMAEEELVRAKEKAEESDRLKTAFLSNMSHEIRTPMNGIMGFTQLLKDKAISPEKLSKYLYIIEKSGKRMLRTINDLVSIAKIEANQVNLNIKEINLNNLLDELHAFFLPEAQKKGLDLTIKNHLPTKSSVILSDDEKLNSILSNLINNALKYTDKGHVEVCCMERGEYIEFKVQDTGIGIAQDRTEAIFDRFVQADIDDKEVREGTGLGLSISKSYTLMLGGEIRVDSKPGKGSVFTFTILKKVPVT